MHFISESAAKASEMYLEDPALANCAGVAQEAAPLLSTLLSAPGSTGGCLEHVPRMNTCVFQSCLNHPDIPLRAQKGVIANGMRFCILI